MKRVLFFVTAAGIALSTSLIGQSVPELNFDTVADLLQFPSYGEVAGIATNSRGHVFTYVRNGYAVATLGSERTFSRNGSRLFEFDQTGKFVREIGPNTYFLNFAQQVRVDPQDNIWAVDAGSSMMVKFDPDGRFLMTLGRKNENINVRNAAGVPARLIDAPKTPPPAGGSPEGGNAAGSGPPGSGTPSERFDLVSDVTWDRAGNIYVADGFGINNRIAKFNKDANWLKGWGQTGSAQGQFNKIRGLVSDAAGNIYVADSGNNRIQVFDGEGTFKSQITGIGSPQALCMTTGPTQYLFSSNSNDPESMNGGEIYKIALNGQVLGKFGRAGRLPREFGLVNALDCRTDTELWVGEVWNWRAQKVTLKK